MDTETEIRLWVLTILITLLSLMWISVFTDIREAVLQVCALTVAISVLTRLFWQVIMRR